MISGTHKMGTPPTRMMKKIKYSLAALAILSIPIILFWAFTTQPFTGMTKPPTIPGVEVERLKMYVKALSSELPPRDIDTDNLDKTVAYIKEHISPYGKPYEQEYDVAGIPYRNLGIRFGPEKGKRIVVGAHFDSIEGLPGADDNASGVAALMELARMLKDKPLKRSVELVFYTLEEPPYFASNDMGSYAHAKMLREQNVDVLLMMSIEMIGYFKDSPHSQHYPLSILEYVYPNTGNFIAIVSNLSGMGIVRRTKAAMLGATWLDVQSINTVPFLTGINFSDHMNYWIHDYPALMITDTAFFRNPHYHTAEDTWEKLDYKRMAQVVKGIYAVIMDYANP